MVAAATAKALVADALSRGLVSHPDEVPQYPQPDGRVKLAAAWLIERSGLSRGYRMGPVGISSHHPLALVHHGGGKTADLLRLALHVRGMVHDRFGVRLTPEPVLLGVDWPDLTTAGETSDIVRMSNHAASIELVDKQHEAEIYLLHNALGMEARITNYGGTVMSLRVPDRHGHLADMSSRL